MEQGDSCIVCGCAVSADDAVCPLCGAELVRPEGAAAGVATGAGAAAGAVAGAGAAAGHSERLARAGHAKGRANGRRALSPKLVAGIAAGAVAVIVVAGFVVHAWLEDRSLNDRAEEAAVPASPGISASASASGTAGSVAGNVAAGGIVAFRDGILYEASSDGVYFRNDLEEGEDARKLVSEGAYDLNVDQSGGRLVFVSSASGDRASFEGSSIRSVEAASGDFAGTRQSQPVYEPPSGARLGCLTVVGDSCYFLEHAGGTYAVKRLNLDDPDTSGADASSGSDASSLDAPDSGASGASAAGTSRVGASSQGQPDVMRSIEADSAWLFAEREALYLVSCTAQGWKAERAALDSSRPAFTEVARGTGALATASLEGGKLYFAVRAASGDVRLQRDDLKNGVIEYKDVVNPVRVAAAGDVVAALTEGGRLAWVDAVTGVSHDLTGQLQSLLPNVVPASAALGVWGEWVCVADGRGGFCRINVNDGTAVGSV